MRANRALRHGADDAERPRVISCSARIVQQTGTARQQCAPPRPLQLMPYVCIRLPSGPPASDHMQLLVLSTLAGGVGNGLVGYLASTNLTTFTHGTYKIDPRKTDEAFKVSASEHLLGHAC